MKITCLRSEFREALLVVGGVVDPRNIKPILKDIRLRTVDGCVELSATDLEVGIKYLVRDVEISEEGGIVVPVDPMAGIMTESKEERLSLSVNDSILLVEGKGSRFQVMGVSEEDFPEIPDFPDEKSLEIEGAIFSEMIEKTIFSVAVEKQRYALNGVLLAAKENSTQLEMVGTDGRRLAFIRRKANAPSPFAASAIIPVKALHQVLKMIGDEEVVKINIQERQVLVKTESAVLAAQLVEGQFPPYDEVVPDDCNNRLEIAADDFGNAIRQAAVLSSRETRAVWLRLENNRLVIESSSAESGEAHVEMTVKYEGEALNVQFNPDFLLDGVKALRDTLIRFEFKDSAKAAVMRSGPDYLYLMMPITQE